MSPEAHKLEWSVPGMVRHIVKKPLLDGTLGWGHRPVGNLLLIEFLMKFQSSERPYIKQTVSVTLG